MTDKQPTFDLEAPVFQGKPILKRIVHTSDEIRQSAPDSISFQHSVMCQLGMPRSKPKGRSFERSSGNASLLMEAGQLFRRGKWVEMPLPYGTRPRLALIHMSTQAIQTRSKHIEIGRSMRDYMLTRKCSRICALCVACVRCVDGHGCRSTHVHRSRSRGDDGSVACEDRGVGASYRTHAA